MKMLKTALFALGLVFAPATLAQQPAPAPATAAPVAAPAAPAPAGIAMVAHDPNIGVPVDGRIGIQPQVTPNGERALWMHDALLMPIITVISLFVLFLLFWASFRYRRNANPVPSKTSHNTFIEVVWTLVPVLILVGIAIPSISLLAAQYKPSPANAVTLKATGNQWYWSYEYPDYDVSFDSTMLKDDDAKAKGEPRLLGVDNRVVLPVGVPIRLLTTASDVLHSWAVPALWTKMDAVPGRTNEASFTIDRAGVYYGQCSELCGARHGFMPIAVQAVSPADFAKWVASRGGKMPGAKPADKPVATGAPSVVTPAPALTPAAPTQGTAPANAQSNTNIR